MVGLLPDVFWSLTWNDYDDLLFYHRYQQQQILAGHRAVAAQLYNAAGSMASNKFKPLAEPVYWPLPLIDPAPKVVDKAADDAWWLRMQELAARSGKRFPTVND